MENPSELAAHFEQARGHLRAVAFRMLGRAHEADDAVQEAWLRASRADLAPVANVAGWLTTIVGRICLDVLRTRRRGLEKFADMEELERIAPHDEASGAEDEAALADSVGLALLVVLDTLGPAERIAFVLHDLFDVPFNTIAAIVERSPVAAKKLASRARHRVRGTPAVPAADILRQKTIVEAFLAASRAGDLDGLLAVLAPDVVRRADRAALPGDVELELRGARRVAEETRTNADRARFARAILVDGKVGAVLAPGGCLRLVLQIGIEDDRVAAIDVIADPVRLRQLRLTVIEPASRGCP